MKYTSHLTKTNYPVCCYRGIKTPGESLPHGSERERTCISWSPYLNENHRSKEDAAQLFTLAQ
jgi:hypothetical protein